MTTVIRLHPKDYGTLITLMDDLQWKEDTQQFLPFNIVKPPLDAVLKFLGVDTVKDVYGARVIVDLDVPIGHPIIEKEESP